jgi:hypothetical protein
MLWLGHSAAAQEAKFKALFLYKFTEYIEWPTGSDNLVVGVVGNSDVLEELKKFTAAKQNIEVINVSSASQAGSCNIVFLPKGENKQFDAMVSSIGKSSILLVSDNKDLVKKGADIGFFLESNKLRFLINKSNIESKKMLPSSKLLELGTTI